MSAIRIICAAAVLLAAASLHAVQMLGVTVDVHDGRYFLRGQSIVAAPRDFVHDILVDYENFHRLTGGIKETRFLPDEADGTRVGLTRLETCVLFFCRKVVKVERILTDTSREIETLAIPEQSDFRFNHTRWLLETVEGGTRITYAAEIEPDFWMPPLIGRWAIKRKLADSAEEIGARIEYLADTGQPITALGNQEPDR